MNWKSFLSRISLVAVAFPILGVLIFVFPQLTHLGFNALVVGVATVGAFETETLFRSRGMPTSRWLVPILAGTLPAAAYLQTAGYLPAGIFGLWTVCAFGGVLAWALVLQRTATLPSFLSLVSGSFFTLLYPAFFMSYVVRLSALPHPSLSIAFYLCLVFGNDMSAYFAGSLWGASTRLNLPVSPQKSVVGFVAGLVGTMIVVFLFWVLAPPGYSRFGLGGTFLAALPIGLVTMLGDLIESGLKRSARVKDSGLAIPGRGGVLDSVDSMILSAPLFYYIFTGHL
jgi:phosphatidate cytidylyltransferase